MTCAIIGVCTSFALSMFIVLSVGNIAFSFSVLISPLNIIGGVFLVLMLSWFDGVSYVFSICSYVLGNCSGWIPMHFNEMDHLPYGHSFIPIFGSHEDVFHLWFISSLDLVFSTWSCCIQWRFFRSTVWQCLQLHASVMFFVIILLFLSSGTFFPSLFG